nr:hypothetical protein B24H17.240 [imported] - Neurospora crassa [Neurospora crassa]
MASFRSDSGGDEVLPKSSVRRWKRWGDEKQPGVPVEAGLSGRCTKSGEDDKDSDCGVIDAGVSGGVGVDHLRVSVACEEGTTVRGEVVSCGLTYLAWAAATERVKLGALSNLLGVAAGVDDGKLEQALESMRQKGPVAGAGYRGKSDRVNEREIFLFFALSRPQVQGRAAAMGFCAVVEGYLAVMFPWADLEILEKKMDLSTGRQ